MDRQKKLLIFGAAWVSAILLTWFLYAKTVAPHQERQVSIVVATHDMPLGTLLRASDVKLVRYPERNLPKGVALEPAEVVNRVILFPLNSGEPVAVSKLSGVTSAEGVSATIEPGYRAVAVQITDTSGLIQPHSRVDVLFTHPGNMAEATTSTILQNVKVLSVGRMAQPGEKQTTQSAAATRSPIITLLLRPDEAQKLELAKNEGRISLSLRNPLDATQAANTGPMSTEALDPMIDRRLALAKKGRVGNPEDPAVWQDLLGKPKEEKKPDPEKPPRAVIDVYHGDKHVQELFK